MEKNPVFLFLVPNSLRASLPTDQTQVFSDEFMCSASNRRVVQGPSSSGFKSAIFPSWSYTRQFRAAFPSTRATPHAVEMSNGVAVATSSPAAVADDAEDDQDALFQSLVAEETLTEADRELWDLVRPDHRRRMVHVLSGRTDSVRVLMENPENVAVNVATVVRTCDAFGVQNFHYVSRDLLAKKRRFKKIYTVPIDDVTEDDAFCRVTRGCHQWVNVVRHPDVVTTIQDFQSQGYKVLASACTDDATPLDELDVSVPTVFVFGNEAGGLSQEAFHHADGRFTIPMCSFVDSLNVAAAAAVTVFTATSRMRKAAPDIYRMAKDSRRATLLKWLRGRTLQQADAAFADLSLDEREIFS